MHIALSLIKILAKNKMEGLVFHFVNEIFPLMVPYANESVGDSSRSEISFPTGRDYATNKKNMKTTTKSIRRVERLLSA